VPVSVAETLDAMRAVAAAGLADRARVREALAAALVKDEADRESFDEVFARFFGASAGAPREAGRPGAQRRLAAATGGGRGGQAGCAPQCPARAVRGIYRSRVRGRARRPGAARAPLPPAPGPQASRCATRPGRFPPHYPRLLAARRCVGRTALSRAAPAPRRP